MSEWIHVVNVPEDAICTCWQYLVLPVVDSPLNGDKVIGAFSHQEHENPMDGYVVPTPRAVLILARDHGFRLGCCAKDCFAEELYPYLFFPADCCLTL